MLYYNQGELVTTQKDIKFLKEIDIDIKNNPKHWAYRTGSLYHIRVGPKFGVEGNHRIDAIAKAIKTKYESGEIENINIERLPTAGRKALNYLLGLPLSTTLIKEDEIISMHDLRRYLIKRGVRKCSIHDVYGWLITYGKKQLRGKS